MMIIIFIMFDYTSIYSVILQNQDSHISSIIKKICVYIYIYQRWEVAIFGPNTKENTKQIQTYVNTHFYTQKHIFFADTYDIKVLSPIRKSYDSAIPGRSEFSKICSS